MISRIIAITAFIALLVFHKDFWNWDNNTLLWGFMPVGLAYHASISIGAALLGAWCCFKCWPKHLDKAGETDA